MTQEHVSRRNVLRGVAAGATATGLAGTAAADRPDRKIVGLTVDAPVGRLKKHADEVHREMDFGDIGKAVAGKWPEPALKGLERSPHVRYVEDDGHVQALAQTLPWGVDRVDADVLHDNGDTGSGADIAIVDTGIDDDHPDLQANVGAGKAYVSCTNSGCNYAWSDDNGHGTHCAGIADAVDNSEGVVGVSTEATLHAVKVLDDQGGGSLSDVAAGIEYVADQGWDVASLSLGASSGSSTLQDAVQYAYGNGVLVVAAAGNSGPAATASATRRRTPTPSPSPRPTIATVCRASPRPARRSNSRRPAAASTRRTTTAPTTPSRGRRWRARTSPAPAAS